MKVCSCASVAAVTQVGQDGVANAKACIKDLLLLLLSLAAAAKRFRPDPGLLPVTYSLPTRQPTIACYAVKESRYTH